jgi:hypothetical protein
MKGVHVESKPELYFKKSLQKKNLFKSKFKLNLRNVLIEGFIWIMALYVYGTENWTHRKEDKKYFESFEIW